jgi:hypothetical protein
MENYSNLSEKVLNQHYSILEKISQQIDQKLEEGATLTPQELKSIYQMHQEITVVLEQHRYKREQYEDEQQAQGKGFFTKMDDWSIKELIQKTGNAEWIEFSIQSTARWFKKLNPEQKIRFRKLIDEEEKR